MKYHNSVFDFFHSGVECPLTRTEFDHGTILSRKEHFYFGDSVNFFCDLGFVVEGNTTISCTEDGTWSSEFPNCTGMSCTLIPIIYHYDSLGSTSSPYLLYCSIFNNQILGWKLYRYTSTSYTKISNTKYYKLKLRKF